MAPFRMPWLHLDERWHAFTHKLFRPSDHTETAKLYDKVVELAEQHGVADDDGWQQLINQHTVKIAKEFGVPYNQLLIIRECVATLFAENEILYLPEIDWDEKRSVAEWWELKDRIKRQQNLLTNFGDTVHLIDLALGQLFGTLYNACPALFDANTDTEGISVPSPLSHVLGDTSNVVEEMVTSFYIEEAFALDIFPVTVGRIEGNVLEASGGDPANPGAFTKTRITPKESKLVHPDELIRTYTRGTPLYPLFQQDVDFTIPQKARFEHHHIIAGTGHGKTQTLQYLIGADLAAVERGERSVVVIDSQGDLINTISQLAEFGPDGPLYDRLVLIDPTDVEYPVSLNLFDVGMGRVEGYSPLDQERLTNSILELYDFVLGTLLDASLTQKQNVIFRYVTRLMLHIPNATIHDLRQLLEEGGKEKYQASINQLTGSARHFFDTEFDDKEFRQTRKQVLRRLWGILENQTFERMFSHPEAKLDLYSELNAGKVILINTAKDLLKESGTELFGRFFIALIAQAAQERSVLPKNKRIPTMVYIDAAQEYFDRNIETILAQARKYNVGMILAHQYLGQLDTKLQEAFAANTSIKFAGGVSNKDARSLSAMLRCEPSMIEIRPKGSFAASIRGHTDSAVPLQFPFGVLEDKEQLEFGEREAVRARMRELYARHHSEIPHIGEITSDDVQEPEDDTEQLEPESNLDHIDLTATSEW